MAQRGPQARRWSRSAASATRRRCCTRTRSRWCAISFSEGTSMGKCFAAGPRPRRGSGGGAVDARRGAQQGLRAMRRQHRPRRLLAARTRRACGAASTSTCAARSPRRCSATPARCAITPLTAQQRFTALQSGEVDILARNTTWTLTRDTSLGAQLRRRQLLRRPGLHGPPQAEREEREGAQRRHRVRAAGDDHRAQPRRLLPRQQHELQAGGDREARRGAERLLRRPLRRLHHRPLRPGRAARARARPSPRTTSSCPRSSPRSRSARRCATATTAGSTW